VCEELKTEMRGRSSHHRYRLDRPIARFIHFEARINYYNYYQSHDDDDDDDDDDQGILEVEAAAVVAALPP
jgi:hypothetical protein